MSESPKSATELKTREKALARKLHKLLWEQRWSVDFRDTRRALAVSGLATVAVWGALKVFRPKGLLNGPIAISVALGAAMHCVSTLSRNIQEVCQQDTPFAARLRLCYQQISEHNILIPHYRQATLQAAKDKSSSS